MKPRTRTSVSADNIPAVQEPPTKIEDEEMRLDPKKVIAAWLASAEVLKDVAKAVRENQEDNELVRASLARNRKWMVRGGIVITTMQALSVALVLRTTHVAEVRIREFVADQVLASEQLHREAQQTRREGEAVRKEASALNAALAAFLDAAVAKDAQAEDAPQRLVEAEVTVAAAQLQVAETPDQRARAELKAKEALKKAKAQSVQVDPRVLEGL